MSFALSGLLAIALWLHQVLPIPLLAAPMPTELGTLPGLGGVFTGEAPALGVKDGQLSPCPGTPNCVVSQGADGNHAIAPISYSGSRSDAQALLAKVIQVVPRTQIVTQADGYIRAKATSRLMGFVDDLEFYFPPNQSVIHLRSAARLGQSDLGVNRRRLEQIRLALRDLGI